MIAYITQHVARYPQMQPQDIVKLIYQNEFGCGHMIADEQSSLLKIQEEYDGIVKKNSTATVQFEPIGNGLCRVYLNQIEHAFSLQTLHAFFLHTANSIKGDVYSFEQKLAQLTQLCKDETLPFAFDSISLSTYLKAYKKMGYPLVSHSEKYRALYRPSYRVIVQEYQKYFTAFSRIDALMRTGKDIIVAIDGNSASGKSTLANLIHNIYDCNVIHMDDFFLQPHQRTPQRLHQLAGNIDYERLMQQVIQNIRNTKKIAYQKFNCQTAVLGDLVAYPSKKLTIIEGVYSMRDEFFGAYDLTIFLSIDPTEQLDRILKRNGAAMQHRFKTEWIPLENEYFNQMNIAQKCDLVYE